jgi:hypothetical protein
MAVFGGRLAVKWHADGGVLALSWRCLGVFWRWFGDGLASVLATIPLFFMVFPNFERGVGETSREWRVEFEIAYCNVRVRQDGALLPLREKVARAAGRMRG